MYTLVSGQSSVQPPSSTPKLTTLALVNVQLNTGLSNNGLKKLVRNFIPNIKQQDGRAKFMHKFPKSRSTLK